MRPSIRLTGVLLLAMVACSESPTEFVASSPDEPSMLLVGSGFTQVSAGGAHTCALRTDGSLACWGANNFNQVSGTPTGTGFSQVSAGGFHTCAVSTDGSLACWGWDLYGQVSNAPTGTSFTQVSAGDLHTCALKTDGSIACWGPGGNGEVSGPPAAGTGFTQVTAGRTHTCALKTDGSLACWGFNASGQVSGPAAAGTGFTQVSAGYLGTCARRIDGSLACWGSDDFGKSSGPAAAGTGFNQVSAGVYHTCALKADGSLACWGDNFFSQVSGTPTGTGFTQVSAGYQHTCARNVDGSLACWGADGSGQVSGIPVAPDLGPITPGTLDPIAVSSTAFSVNASFTDPDVLDTHTATIDWGDGSTSSGTVAETGGSGTVTGSHLYTTAGVYPVCITLSDDDGGSDAEVYEYVVVYDPSAGFVTGGGWIDSPAGAYAPDPSLSGKAHFGFTSRYSKGKSTPSGSTQFQFRAGDMTFHSDVQDWLVVNQGGSNARFKGTGTINGTGTYKFMIWAGDDSPDTFRIRIWEETGGVETDVYDNGVQQAIDGGSIVIHAK